MKLLALIPARGGSKGIKKKNIVPLCGKPLIWYTIEAAKKSGVFHNIVVSTDSEEIAEISRKWGASVPFKRPDYLATDDAKGIDVVLHAMEFMENQGESYDAIMVLQPTSPLRTSGDIRNAVRVFSQKNANAVVSITEADHPPLWINTIPPDGRLDDFLLPEARNKNRQELPKYYRLNGAIFLARWEYLKKYRDWFKKDCFAYIMPRERSVDIDAMVDLLLAEALLKLRGECNGSE